MLKKTNDASFGYDEKSGALLNTDEEEWKRYQAERAKLLEHAELKKQIQQLTARVMLIEEKLRNV